MLLAPSWLWSSFSSLLAMVFAVIGWAYPWFRRPFYRRSRPTNSPWSRRQPMVPGRDAVGLFEAESFSDPRPIGGLLWETMTQSWLIPSSSHHGQQQGNQSLEQQFAALSVCWALSSINFCSFFFFLVDTGASNHMTHWLSILSSPARYSGHPFVYTGDNIPLLMLWEIFLLLPMIVL